MKRNFRTEGIVLKNNRFAEIHKGLTLLSPEYGLMSAVAYGAYSPKGKLRGLTNPLCAGTFFVYRDPVKDSCKISDVDCREFFEGVRGSIVKFFVSSVWFELVLKTFGGDSRETFSLVMDSLRLLDSLEEGAAGRLLVQFIWRYLRLSGLAPDTASCTGCGRPVSEADGPGELVYRRGFPGFFCPACAEGDESVYVLSAGALGYLRYTGGVSLERASGAVLDAASFGVLKRVLLFLAEDLAGGELKSVRTGAGVL